MPLSEGGNNPAITPSLEKLSKTAISLNQASDALNRAVEKLNQALKKLNLGISSWVTFYDWQDGPDMEYQEIGYGKIFDKWGIGIKRTTVDMSLPPEDQTHENIWQFSEAPRDMRIAAMPYLSKVIEQLNKDAEQTTKVITEKTADAEELAKAIEALLDPPRRSVDTRGQR